MKCPECQAAISDDSQFCSKCGASLKVDLGSLSLTRTILGPVLHLKKGQKIAGKYKIVEKIGEGGMGIVYKAEDTKLKRHVALKFLPSELTRDKKAKARFMQEAQAAAALNHPHICIIHEVDESADQTYIAMEFIEGQTLKDKIEAGPLAIDEAIDIASQVAEGLGEAHKKGIIHRDIKPANIMVTEKGQAKIMDFGLAKLTSGADLTKPAAIMGTVAYMSPEQARGETVDHRTDIWSLGAMLYEMLTGEKPFQKSQEHALIHAILNEKPEPLITVCPDIPRIIERAVLKALEKEPIRRHQNIAELLKDLKPAEDIDVNVPKEDKSIIVLPFEDMSPGKDNEYFSDGLTEEIIADLSKIRSLRVISRTSSMMLKETRKSMKTISRELGVRYALEGSVRKAGNDLRITAQLIDAENDAHLWAEKYSGNLDDVFGIQGNVSESVAAALRIVLTPSEKGALQRKEISDVRAFECLLRARAEIWKGTESSIKQAIHYLDESRKIEGEKIEILSALGEAHFLLPHVTGRGITETMLTIEDLANRILKIDSASSHGYLLMALAVGKKPWGFRRGGKLLKRACELDPTNTTALLMRATFAAEGGYPKIAMECSDSIAKLDPLSPVVWMNRAFIFMILGEYDESSEQLKKALTFDPKNSYYRGCAIMTYANASNLKAVENIAKDLRVEITDNFARMGVLYESALKQREEDFKDIISPEFIATAEWDETFSWALSQCYAGVGNVEKSLYWLKNAMERCFINYPFLSEMDPFIARIRDDDRVQEVLKQIKSEWENFEV